MAELEKLNTTGFKFEQIEIDFAMLEADYGDGYKDSALIGSTQGLRAWSMRVDVLPDSLDQAPPIAGTGETRAAYLWKFFCRSKAAGNQPFWFRHADPGEDERDWLAEFVDHKLSFSILCAKLYSTGLQLRQRRLRDQESPSDPQPEENPDVI